MNGKLAAATLTAWVTFSGPLAAQKTAIEVARDAFVACARASAVEQYAATAQKQMAVELAFQSCATEEQVMVVAGLTSGASPSRVRNTVALFKLRLKQDIIARFP